MNTEAARKGMTARFRQCVEKSVMRYLDLTVWCRSNIEQEVLSIFRANH